MYSRMRFCIKLFLNMHVTKEKRRIDQQLRLTYSVYESPRYENYTVITNARLCN